MWSALYLCSACTASPNITFDTPEAYWQSCIKDHSNASTPKRIDAASHPWFVCEALSDAAIRASLNLTQQHMSYKSWNASVSQNDPQTARVRVHSVGLIPRYRCDITVSVSDEKQNNVAIVDSLCEYLK